jgi:8-oxo-dGTP pyrophosphatase MutT (NUDIX family)
LKKDLHLFEEAVLALLNLTTRPLSVGVAQPRASVFTTPPTIRAFRMAATAASANSETIPGSLQGRRDMYDGLIIDGDTLPSTITEFVDALASSLPAWKEANCRGIWLKLPISKAHYVGHTVDAGFEFHHAEPGFIMLTQWLPQTENKLPPNASHQVGVGAFVYDKENNRVLVVQEKNGPLRGKGVWKMPTGLVHAGEDITEAAKREVEEETGIKTTFHSVLAMRQAHGLAFGKSDMFFVVALDPVQPVSEQVIVPQEDEVEAAAWISLEEYASIEFHLQRPLLKKIMEKCSAYAKGQYSGLGGYKLSSGFSGRSDLLLFGEGGEEAAVKGEDEKNEDAWIGLS